MFPNMKPQDNLFGNLSQMALTDGLLTRIS